MDEVGTTRQIPSSLIQPQTHTRSPRSCTKSKPPSRKRKKDSDKDNKPRKPTNKQNTKSNKKPGRNSSKTTSSTNTSTTKSNSVSTCDYDPLIKESKEEIHQQLTILNNTLLSKNPQPSNAIPSNESNKQKLKQLNSLASQLTEQITKLLGDMAIDTSVITDVSPLTEPVNYITDQENSAPMYLRGGGDPDPLADDTNEDNNEPNHTSQSLQKTTNPYLAKKQTRYDGPNKGRIKACKHLPRPSLHDPNINTYPSKRLCKLLTTEPENISYEEVQKLPNYEQKRLVMTIVHHKFAKMNESYDKDSWENQMKVQDLALKCSTRYLIGVIKGECTRPNGEPYDYQHLYETMIDDHESHCLKVRLLETSPLEFARYATTGSFPRDDDRDDLIDTLTMMGTTITKNYYERYHEAVSELPRSELLPLVYFPGRFVLFLTESFPAISVDLPTPIANIDTNSLPFFEYPDDIDLETVSYAPSKWLRLNCQELDNMKPADRKIHVRNITERFFKPLLLGTHYQ